MPVKIRLTKRGRKKLALYDIVIANSKSPRDGRFIEKIGAYNPGLNPAAIELNEEKAFQWIMNGAQPTDTVRNILSEHGIMLKKHLQIGVLKGAITQDKADKQFEEWKNKKESAAAGKVGDLAKKKEDAKKAKLAAETKVNEARKEALKTKNIVVEEVAAAPKAEAIQAEEQVPAPTAAEIPLEEKAPAAPEETKGEE
jgi:small subunit ribosomal protein S16